MRFTLLMMFIFFSSNVLSVSEEEFNERYSTEIAPYYNSFPLKFHSYSNNPSKKFPYKYINNKSSELVVILPGKGEPLERYAETLFDLKDISSDKLIVQFRGQGYSSRSLKNAQKTHIRKFNYVIDDLDSLFKYLDIRNKYQRITLLAHSMGAHHGLRYELAHPIFDHLILNSPMVGILDSDETKKNYYLTLLLISLGMGGNYVPGKGDWQDWPFEQNDVSQSMTRYLNFRRIDIENPTVRLGSVSVRWANEAIKSEKKLFKSSQKIMSPVTIFQAGKEFIVSNEKQNLLCEQLPNCELIRVENSMHNFLQEKDEYRDQFIDYVKSVL